MSRKGSKNGFADRSQVDDFHLGKRTYILYLPFYITFFTMKCKKISTNSPFSIVDDLKVAFGYLNIDMWDYFLHHNARHCGHFYLKMSLIKNRFQIHIMALSSKINLLYFFPLYNLRIRDNLFCPRTIFK